MKKILDGYQPTTETKTKPPNTGSAVWMPEAYIPKFKKHRFVKVFTCDYVEEIEEKINDYCYEHNVTLVDVKIHLLPETAFITVTTILEGLVIVND